MSSTAITEVGMQEECLRRTGTLKKVTYETQSVIIGFVDYTRHIVDAQKLARSAEGRY